MNDTTFTPVDPAQTSAVAARFLKECCRYSPTGTTRSDDLLAGLRLWCCFEGLAPANASQLGRAVKRVFPQVKRHREHGGGSAYRGLLLVEV